MTKSPAEIFFELTAKEGECWHDWKHYVDYDSVCKKCGIELDCEEKYNPDYSNPADILRRMKEHLGENGFKQFIQELILYSDLHSYDATSIILWLIYKYILNAPDLLDKAIEYLKMKGE